MDRLSKQIGFILEADKIKQILRVNYVADGSKRENDAEHSWHLALMAILLSEHANEKKLDILRVVKMLLIHDIVEIDAGDAYVYDPAAKAQQKEKEIKAAERIFNLLPEDQAREYRILWDEFEEKKTPESKYANALDRLHPMLMNFESKGISWIENEIKKSQVIEKNKHMSDGSDTLWDYTLNTIIQKAEQLGYYSKE